MQGGPGLIIIDGNWNEKSNINFPSDNVINILDFNIFAGQWLIGTEE